MVSTTNWSRAVCSTSASAAAQRPHILSALEHHRFIRKLVDTEISDVIQATEANIEAADVQDLADLIVRSLFSSFIDEPALLPAQTLAIISETGRGLHRVVCDHIAGMTDRYAIAEYRRLFDPEEVV